MKLGVDRVNIILLWERNESVAYMGPPRCFINILAGSFTDMGLLKYLINVHMSSKLLCL